jgi:hypothetical protein
MNARPVPKRHFGRHARSLLPAMLVAALLAGPAEAEPSGFGMGMWPCRMWTAAQHDGQASEVEQWIVGFLTGVGWMGFSTGVDPWKGMDAPAVWGWVDNYCLAHPLDNVAKAGEAFVDAHPH